MRGQTLTLGAVFLILTEVVPARTGRAAPATPGGHGHQSLQSSGEGARQFEPIPAGEVATTTGWICGVVGLDSSSPVPKVEIDLLRHDAKEEAGITPAVKAWTAGDGSFCLEFVPPGLYDMRPAKDPWPPQPTRQLEVRVGLVHRVGLIMLEPGVGELGDPKALSFEGVETFTPETILRGLLSDPAFFLSSHPLALLRDYLDSTRKAILSGYLANGFPRVQASAIADPKLGKVVVRVAEGPRYMSGGVRVSGGTPELARKIVQRLTTTTPAPDSIVGVDLGLLPEANSQAGAWFAAGSRPANEPTIRVTDALGRKFILEPALWIHGKPAPFAKGSLNELGTKLRDILADFGYFSPKIDVKVMPGSDGKTASLAVGIADLGPKAILHDVEVTGQTRATPEEVLRYLALAPGMPIDSEVIAKAQLALWRSGRFRESTISVERGESTQAGIRLKVELDDYKPAPGLSRDLSSEEKTMAQACEWLSDAPLRNSDVVFTFSGLESGLGPLQIVLSRKGAVVVLGRRTITPATWLHALFFDKEGMVLFARPLRRKMILSAQHANLWVQWKFQLGAPKDENKVHQTINIQGLRSDELESIGMGSGFRFSVLAPPVACLAGLHQEGAVHTQSGGILHVRWKGNAIEADAQSGRVIRFLSSMDNETQVDTSFEQGAYERVKKLVGEGEGYGNFADARDLLSSLISYLGTSFLQDQDLAPIVFKQVPPQTRARAARALEKLMATRPFEPLQESVATLWGEHKGFRIPFEWEEDTAQSAAEGLAAYIFSYVNELFPRKSWPWTVAHEAAFFVGGHREFTDMELQRIYESEETGPLGYLVVASLLKEIDSPAAGVFAREGLLHLSTAHFRKDVRLMVEESTPVAQAVNRIAAALGGLEQEDIDALVACLPAEGSAFLLDNYRLLHKTEARPTAESFLSVFDRYWEEAVRGKVRAKLNGLAQIQ